jgi:PhnB protein
METDNGAASVPPGYSGVDPWVISRDTPAEIGFLSRVFGGRERPGSRMLNADGTVGHVEVELAGSVVMMFDAQPGWPPLPAHLRVYVDDAAAAFDRAVAAGAAPVTRVTELFFGERVGRVRDPQGHLWWIHERVETLDPEELGRRLEQPSFREAMAYVQESGAAELGRDLREDQPEP